MNTALFEHALMGNKKKSAGIVPTLVSVRQLLRNCLFHPLVIDHLLMQVTCPLVHTFANEIFATYWTRGFLQTADIGHLPFRERV